MSSYYDDDYGWEDRCAQDEADEAERLDALDEERNRDETNPHFEEESRRICPDCHGLNIDLVGDSGGGCPSCFGGYV